MKKRRATPKNQQSRTNAFKRWKPLRRYAAALDKPVTGKPAEQIISEDRDR